MNAKHLRLTAIGIAVCIASLLAVLAAQSAWIPPEPIQVAQTVPGSCAYRPEGCTNATFDAGEGRKAYCAIWNGGSSCRVETATRD